MKREPGVSEPTNISEGAHPARPPWPLTAWEWWAWAPIRADVTHPAAQCPAMSSADLAEDRPHPCEAQATRTTMLPGGGWTTRALCRACGGRDCPGVAGGVDACPRWQEAEARADRGEWLPTTPGPAWEVEGKAPGNPGERPGPAP